MSEQTLNDVIREHRDLLDSLGTICHHAPWVPGCEPLRGAPDGHRVADLPVARSDLFHRPRWRCVVTSVAPLPLTREYGVRNNRRTK